MIGSLFRRILPFIKSVTPHALRSGANIVDDVKSGKTWKEAVFKRVPETIGAFTRGQTGSGKRKSVKRHRRKRAGQDIFS